MDENEINIRREIDIDYDRSDFSNNKFYVEFFFYTCFYELFVVENSSWETNLTGTEVEEILNLLQIPFDKNFVISRYEDRKNHDVEVFHSIIDDNVFAYFDLEKEITDQNDMFGFGIRCHVNQDDEIMQKLLSIYRQLQTASDFSYDRRIRRLYNNTFRSYFYFYHNNYNKHKRQLNHHNRI